MRVLQRFIVSIVVSFNAIALSACGGGGGGNTTPSNSVPTASAGGDLTVTRNAVVPLDGSGVDADGDALAYRWVQTSGTAVRLSSTTAAKPTFTAPAQSGTLVFALVTSDGKSESTADSVTVSVENRAPTAVLLSPTAAPGKMAILDGSGSSDPDGDTLSYQWTQLSGPSVTITPSAPGLGQFQVPNTPVTLVFALTVSDGEAASISVSVTINVTVLTDEETPNRAPVVFAGDNLVVARRSVVLLQGWAYDADRSGLSYSWEQIEGPVVTLSDAHSMHTTFNAPETSGLLKFVLNVSDGELTTKSAPVAVDVINFAPWILNATLVPHAPQTNDPLTVTAEIGDADQDSVSRRYEWKRNGVLVPSQTTASYPANLTTKNDVITVQVIASDGALETAVDASTTIMDSPAVLAAIQPPPTAIDYGDTVTFTVTATDADGDTIPGLEVAHGPAGFAISPQGTVTWTAVGPMFDKVMDFKWGVRVSGDASSLLSGTFTVTDAARLSPVRRSGVQIPVQNSGLQIDDFDGNGSSEMLVGSRQAVSVLEKSGPTYQESWVYPFEVANPNNGGYAYGGDVAAVAAKDLNGDGKQEILFSKNDVLIQLNGVTRRESARSNLHCRSLEIADLDQDGALDLVCLSATSGYFYGMNAQVVVLDALTLAQKWSTPTLALGNSLAVGNVDNDSALEIVTAGGFVFDGQTQHNQWLYSQAFGSVIDTGDLDGDGVEEIAGMNDWSAVRVFSAVLKSPLWEFVPTWSDLDTLIIADANSDGRVEIITSNGQGGDIMAIGYDVGAHNLQLQWQIDSQNSGVSSIAVGDVDGDGVSDVVWGSGSGSSGRDDLVVAGFTPTISIKWKSSVEPQFDGGFRGGALARIGGGSSRLMFGTPKTDSGYAGMRLIALDPSTGRLEFSREIGTNWGYGRGFDVADYDLDNVDEVFVGTAEIYESYFAVYDFAADAVAWESPRVSFESAVAVTHGDMNADGHDDFIGITSNGYIYVFDLHAQTLLWKSTGLGASGIDVAVADLNQDGQQDIIAATSDRVVVYGKASNSYIERASVANSDAKDLLVADLGAGMKIYTIDDPWSGTILKTYDGQLNLLSSLDLGVGAESLSVEESAFTRKNLLISTTPDTYSLSSPTEFWAIDPLTGAEVWHSPPLTGSVPVNSVQFIDVDSDGDKEIVFATSQGMHFTR